MQRCISFGGRCPGGTASTPLICRRSYVPPPGNPACQDSKCVDRCGVWVAEGPNAGEVCFDVGAPCAHAHDGANSICVKDSRGARCVTLLTPSLAPSPKPCDTSVNCEVSKGACVLRGELCPDGTWCVGLPNEPPSCAEVGAALSVAGTPLADVGRAANVGRAATDASLEAAASASGITDAAALSAGVQHISDFDDVMRSN